MTRKLLIDAAHPEETRLVVMSEGKVAHFEAESSRSEHTVGNIYLVQVTRVEASLQASFVEYGGKRHGFLSFQDIHPDYYQIPVADRQAPAPRLHEAEADEPAMALEDAGADSGSFYDDPPPPEPQNGREPEEPRYRLPEYKIQEVIKNRQVILAQVLKEPRSNKGAALTSYISLPGRHCILMPNATHQASLSRKILDPRERKRLHEILAAFPIPEGMSLIIRTSGMGRSAEEIRQDFDYLLALWEKIRDVTLESVAPALVHEDGNTIRRALRDIYSGADEVAIEGKEAYEDARNFMQTMLPSEINIIKLHEGSPIFTHYGVEKVLEDILTPIAQLKSGGYLVINQTEALVAIDVNSGRATGERHIQETALATNLEAADEIARQLHLRDLAGLVVIDFIDMSRPHHNREVERRLRTALYSGQAHARVGHISNLGLMELSVQRLRPALWEGRTQLCPHCQGQSRVLAPEAAALGALRAVEALLYHHGGAFKCKVTLRLRRATANWLLRDKQEWIESLRGEGETGLALKIDNNISAHGKGFLLDDPSGHAPKQVAPEAVGGSHLSTPEQAVAAPAGNAEGGYSGRRQGRGRGRRGGEDRRQGRGRGKQMREGGKSPAHVPEDKKETRSWWQRLFTPGG